MLSYSHLIYLYVTGICKDRSGAAILTAHKNLSFLSVTNSDASDRRKDTDDSEEKRVLLNERQRITDVGSLMILDVLVEFATRELVDVEIQKIDYRFPGQRASCYSSDMVMRQYERVKGIKGNNFTYRDMKKVYTIVIMEDSGREFRRISGQYIHRGEYQYDTGINPGHLEKMCYIALDNFLDIMDNKRKGDRISELEAWLYFIGSDKVEHIHKVIEIPGLRNCIRRLMNSGITRRRSVCFRMR